MLEMKDTFIGPRCASCFVETAVNFLKEVTADNTTILSGLEIAMKVLQEEFKVGAYTFIIGNKLARKINEFVNPVCEDIFARIKRKSNEVCMEIYPKLLEKYESIRGKDEKLGFVLSACVAGNTIDVGTAGHTFSLDPDEIFAAIGTVRDDWFAIDHTTEFMNILESSSATSVLIMLDNAGEIVFDKLLILFLKEMGKKVYCMVRGSPIANDATIDDARAVGIDKICDGIIETSIASLGYTIPDNDQEIIDKVNGMDLIIGKGQANTETLSTYSDEIRAGNVFVLSKVKCETVANWKGVSVGDNIFQKVK
ncbi:MAG: damage-control phosphatase ARMT1 family protein [Promethearchaeota archaeon]